MIVCRKCAVFVRNLPCSCPTKIRAYKEEMSAHKAYNQFLIDNIFTGVLSLDNFDKYLVFLSTCDMKGIKLTDLTEDLALVRKLLDRINTHATFYPKRKSKR